MMAAKKSTDVMIAGKVYTLSGYEEEGYLQHVASYINTKISEITERDEYRRIPNDMKSILIQLNIADDYFKAKKQYEAAEENYKKAEKDLFELKHELVDTQMKVEELLEKLNRERQERNQKSDRENRMEENYKRLEERYEALAGNVKVAEERNRQFEEMLRLTQQEKREIEAVNKELRLNKEKLEATLADALLGTASSGKDTEEHFPSDASNGQRHSKTEEKKRLKEADSKLLTAKPPTDDADSKASVPQAFEAEDFLAPTELSKEEVRELRDAVHETMAELSKEKEDAAGQEMVSGHEALKRERVSGQGAHEQFSGQEGIPEQGSKVKESASEPGSQVREGVSEPGSQAREDVPEPGSQTREGVSEQASHPYSTSSTACATI